MPGDAQAAVLVPAVRAQHAALVQRQGAGVDRVVAVPHQRHARVVLALGEENE